MDLLNVRDLTIKDFIERNKDAGSEAFDKDVYENGCNYSASLLKTSQCLAIAQGAIAGVLVAIDKGQVGPHLVETLKRDQAKIKSLMA